MSIADELITRGWCQGEWEDMATGQVCLEGAVAASLGLKPWDWQLVPARVWDAVCVVCDLPPGGWGRIMSWNDEDGRTFDEVLRAAKHADEILDSCRV